jgi:hypothetical protein
MLHHSIAPLELGFEKEDEKEGDRQGIAATSSVPGVILPLNLAESFLEQLALLFAALVSNGAEINHGGNNGQDREQEASHPKHKKHRSGHPAFEDGFARDQQRDGQQQADSAERAADCFGAEIHKRKLTEIRRIEQNSPEFSNVWRVDSLNQHEGGDHTQRKIPHALEVVENARKRFGDRLDPWLKSITSHRLRFAVARVRQRDNFSTSAKHELASDNLRAFWD